MGRRYTRAEYLAAVRKLREFDPEFSLTTDVIVGYPGETEADFEATMDMLRRGQYDAIFSFIYSPRKGTPAAEMTDQVPYDISTARFEKMLALQNDISLARNQRFVGRTMRVLAEEISHGDSSRITARGDSPRPIHFVADPSVIGQFVNVKITAADTFSLSAEIGTPPISTVPRVGFSRPASWLSRVDLPEPEVPKMQTISPRVISRSMF
jgi:tRNA-2-methylthio-N6-dimethylallyladenosine synthase